MELLVDLSHAVLYYAFPGLLTGKTAYAEFDVLSAERYFFDSVARFLSPFDEFIAEQVGVADLAQA